MTPAQTAAGAAIPVGPPDRAGGPPAPPQGSRRTWHLWANAVVLAYVLLALLTLLLHDWSVLSMPRWLAVHLLLLGAATNAIVTWTEHFAVALLRARAPSRAVSAARLGLLNLAIVAVLIGVSADLASVTIAGATLLGLVVLAHLGSLVRISRTALMGRFAGTIAFYVMAGLALAAGIVLGTVTAVGAVPHETHEQLHAAHVHANVFGWVGLTVLGTLFTLWPTVLRTRMADHVMRTAKICLGVTTAGLAASVVGLAADVRPLALAGLGLYALGVLIALEPFVRTWRRKSPRDAAAWHMAAATGWLAAGTIADLVLLATSSTVPGYVDRLSALVPALAVGFVLQMLLGALTYLLPVILSGGPAKVRENIASLSRIWLVRLVALNLGTVAVWLTGALGAPSAAVAAGWVLIGAAVLAFLVLVVATVTPPASHSPLAGVGLGMAMTVLPVLIAVSGQVSPIGPSSVAVNGGSQTLAITLIDMDIRPGTIQVPAGTDLTLVVTNKDAMRHDLAFPDSRALPGGMSTPLLSKDQTSTLKLGVVTTDLFGWCTVPGHKAAGMTLNITITGAPRASKGHTMPGMSTMPGMGGSGTTDGTATRPVVDVHGQPGAGWKPYDAALAPASTATVHRLTLRAIEKEAEVAPGVVQKIWTFNGTAPGPTLRGHVGDTFIVTLINDGTMDHSIDFHAGQNAPDEVMRDIAPGESLVYRFTADHSGAWLYHCATMPMLQHIANGMYGAVIIDPPGLDRVDHEFVMVGAQLFVGSKDGGADPARLRADDWDAATYNGYPDQYVHAPLTVKAGERVRWWVVAAGPIEGTAFHIVGTQFDTVFKEGAYLLRRDNPEHGASQVLDLSPAQGGFVENTFVEPGHYSIIDHDMRRGENGAHGTVEVTP